MFKTLNASLGSLNAKMQHILVTKGQPNHGNGAVLGTGYNLLLLLAKIWRRLSLFKSQQVLNHYFVIKYSLFIFDSCVKSIQRNAKTSLYG